MDRVKMLEIMYVVILISNIISLWYCFELQSKLQAKSLDKCMMYYAKEEIYINKTRANGLYWYGTDFYCVWAKYRTLEEQEKTDRHEYCHYLVDNDYEHFCK